MVFKNSFPSQMNMNHLEYTFQSLYKQHPELSLDLPHSLEYCREILEQTAAITGNSFPKELLNSTPNPDISLSVIAEELGYQDSGNFRHTFKKFYGVTPAEYRDMK